MAILEVKVNCLKIPEVIELSEELAYLRAFHKQVMYCFAIQIDDMKKDLDESWEANGLKVPGGY